MATHLPRIYLAACLWALSEAAAPVFAADNTVTLDFANADLPTVIQAVSKMIGKPVVVDPRVKGTLNLVTPKPVSKAQAYELLLAALRLQGYAVANTSGVMRVLPEADAKYQGVPMTEHKGKMGSSGEIISRVFKLKNESAASLVTVLRPLISPNNVVSADPGSNALLVTDYADNMARLAAVIDSLDVPNNGEPEVITLKHAAAQDVATLIGKVFTFQAGPGNVGNERVDVAVDPRSNSLVLSCDNPARLERVRSLIGSLDQPSPNAGNVHVLYLKNAEATHVAQVLRGMLSGDSSGMQTAANPQAAAAVAGAASAGSTGSGVVGSGMIVADSATNALIITAPEVQFQNIKAAIDKLDVRRAQVLVEAMIAEVSADKAAQFGIQWMSLTKNGVIGGFGNSGSNNIATVAQNPASAAQGFNLGYVHGTTSFGSPTTGLDANGNQYTINPAANILNLGMLASALQTDAGANILSTPTLLTLDNEEAKISVGANVPFQTGSYSVSAGTSASPFTTIERKDVGLILKVKPQISEGGTVRLAISEEVSSIQGSGGILAATNKRSIDTTVLIDDGQIVVLGGLIEDQVQDTEDKVPLLGDIPLLGHLFRYSNRTHNKTNLMVFLRPVIVRNADDASKVSNPRYEQIIGLQKSMAPPHKLLLPDVEAPTLRVDSTLSNEAKPLAVPAVPAQVTSPQSAAQPGVQPASSVPASTARPVATSKPADPAGPWYQPASTSH